MKGRLWTTVHRRDLFRIWIASTAIAAGGTLAIEAAVAEPLGSANKRRARYRPNSAEVRNFYRVNSYPAR